jgi:hypothetical protein
MKESPVFGQSKRLTLPVATVVVCGGIVTAPNVVPTAGAEVTVSLTVSSPKILVQKGSIKIYKLKFC